MHPLVAAGDDGVLLVLDQFSDLASEVKHEALNKVERVADAVLAGGITLIGVGCTDRELSLSGEHGDVADTNDLSEVDRCCQLARRKTYE